MSSESESQSDALFGQQLGYIRVSAADQNPGRQYETLGRCDKYFEDKISGKSRAKRAALTEMIGYARQGDNIRVASLDRLGRNTRDLYAILDELTVKGCSVTFVAENITVSKNNTTPMEELFLSFLSAMAQFERARIRERQSEGIALAKAKGKYDEQRALSTGDVEACRALVEMGLAKAEVARRYNVSRQTLYSALNGAGVYAC